MSMMPEPTSVAPNGEGDFDLSNMSEEELQQLVALGVIDENMAENARQMALQEGLRYGDMPEGRDSGRVYTAANPLEHVGKLMQQYNAQKKMDQLGKERVDMGKQQTAGRGTYWDLLRGKKKKWMPEIGEIDPSEYEMPSL